MQRSSEKRRRLVRAVFAVVLGLAILQGTSPARVSAGPAAAAGKACATTADPTPPAGQPCWVDVDPYPFGSDGTPVDTSGPRCRATPVACYLTANSFAFRAWNRGLAATQAGSSSTAFGVWIWNGVRWYPDPTFPGARTCQGDHVLWAGKLDYWLVGPGPSRDWASLCRFDGVNFLWQPLPVPKATLAKVTPPGQTTPESGGITSGACLSWNNCWFFGSFGATVHWDGRSLADASPPADSTWLRGEVNAAALGSDGSGNSFGLAAASTAAIGEVGAPLPAGPGGETPPQLKVYTGAGWQPTTFAAPTFPVPGDPFRTDLVGLDLLSNGGGWVAGVPSGWRPGVQRFDKPPPNRQAVDVPVPAPIIPLGPLGSSIPCPGPAADAFTFSLHDRSRDSYLWSSIAAVPGSGNAIAGGQVQPATSGPPPSANADDSPEPVIAQVTCGGQVTRTRFRVADPTASAPGQPLVPATRLGSILAVAANAPNDAWASTSLGVLDLGSTQTALQQPHVYRLSDGMAPQAPPGNDIETRPILVQQDAPIIVVEPLPPSPPAGPPSVVTGPEIVQPPAIYDVRVKLVKLTLVLRFSVRRTTTLGLEALRGKRLVAHTGLKTFNPSAGVLRLPLTRKRWPTRVRFKTDLPSVHLADPGTRLAGPVTLSATATAIRGRTIASVRFDYALAGTSAWNPAGQSTARPFTLALDTTTLADGTYDFRAVATDSKGRAAQSNVVEARAIRNSAG